jgi:hypothetical protein
LPFEERRRFACLLPFEERRRFACLLPFEERRRFACLCRSKNGVASRAEISGFR